GKNVGKLVSGSHVQGVAGTVRFRKPSTPEEPHGAGFEPEAPWIRAQFSEGILCELCPNPRRLWFESGPVGLFWRRWLSEADCTGDTLHVRTTDEFAYVFS